MAMPINPNMFGGGGFALGISFPGGGLSISLGQPGWGADRSAFSSEAFGNYGPGGSVPAFAAPYQFGYMGGQGGVPGMCQQGSMNPQQMMMMMMVMLQMMEMMMQQMQRQGGMPGSFPRMGGFPGMGGGFPGMGGGFPGMGGGFPGMGGGFPGFGGGYRMPNFGGFPRVPMPMGGFNGGGGGGIPYGYPGPRYPVPMQRPSYNVQPGGGFGGPSPTPPANLQGNDLATANFINNYLAQHNSPAAAQNAGSLMVQYGRQYNVDPLMLLSIAGQETNFGKAGIGVNGMLGVGAYDANPRNALNDHHFSGVENQIRVGAQTFAKLRARGGASANSPLADQAAVVNRAGWATDHNWHNGVMGEYSRISRSAQGYNA